MKILVDIDGVTVDMVQKILDELNWEFKTFFQQKDIRDWNFFSKGSTYDLLTNTQKEFIRSRLDTAGFCYDLELIPHVDETLTELVNQGCKITWLTAPWKSSETWIEDRTKMIHERLGHISTDIVFSWDKENTPGDLLIDDNPEFLEKWLNKNKSELKKGLQTLLFRQPWNEDYAAKNGLSLLDGWKDKRLHNTVMLHKIHRTFVK